MITDPTELESLREGVGRILRVDPAELEGDNATNFDAFVADLAQNNDSLDEAFSEAANSDAAANTRNVITFFQVFLGRLPAEGGLTFWTGVANGEDLFDSSDDGSLAALRQSFVTGNEFNDRFDEFLSFEGVVRQLFNDVLLREPGLDGLTFWTGAAEQRQSTLLADGASAEEARDGAIQFLANAFFEANETESTFAPLIEDLLVDMAQNGDAAGLARGTLIVPLAEDDSATVAEDGTVNIDVLANDVDRSSNLAETEIALEDGADNGTAVVNADGTISYTPDADFNGEDSFTYTITDEDGDTDTATVTVDVSGENDAPVAEDDAASTNEDTTSAPINVLVNDTDIDGDTLDVTGATAANGSVTVNADNTLSYTPNADFNGVDTITYAIADGNGGTDSAEVTVTVAPVNDAPVAGDDSAITDEDTPVNVAVLANDSDVDGDALSVTSALAGNGTVAIESDGSLTYTPNADFNGTDTITYTVDDGNGGTDSADVTVNVNPVNDAPVANDDAVTVTNEDTDTIAAATLLANDTDVEGDALTITGASADTGTVSVNGNGDLVYAPAAEAATDEITYTVSDGNGGTDTATVNVTINDTFTAASPDTVVEGSPLTVTVSGATPGDTVSFQLVADTADASDFTAGDFANKTATADASGNATFTVNPTNDNQLEPDETVGYRVLINGELQTGSVVIEDAPNDNATFILTDQQDTIVPGNNSTGQPVGTSPDDTNNRFVADDETLNPTDVLDGGGQPADGADEVFYSTDTVLPDGPDADSDPDPVRESGFETDDIERFIAQSNGSGVVFDHSKDNSDNVGTGIQVVGSSNSAASVSHTELRTAVDVDLDNLTNAGGNNDVTVLSDADEAASDFVGATEVTVTHDDSDVQNLTVGLDTDTPVTDGLETINLVATGETPSLGALINPQGNLETLNVTVDTGDGDDFVLGDASTMPATAVQSGAFTDLNVSNGAGQDGDFRLVEDIRNGNNPLNIDASGLDGNFVATNLTLDGRAVSVVGGNNDDFVGVSGAPNNDNDSFSLGGGANDAVLIDETDADGGFGNGLAFPTNGGTEFMDIVDNDGGGGVDGQIDAREHQGLDGGIRLRNGGFDIDDLENGVTQLGGIGGAGLTILSARQGNSLFADLSQGAGPLTIDMVNTTATDTYNLNLETGNGGAVNFAGITTQDVDELIVNVTGTADLNIQNLSDNAPGFGVDNDLDRIELNSTADVTIGNGDNTLFEQGTGFLDQFDGSGSTGDLDIRDLTMNGFTPETFTGSGNDQVALTAEQPGNLPDGPGVNETDDLIETNGGNDRIYVADLSHFDQDDTIRGGSGRDAIVVQTNPGVVLPIVDALFTNTESVEQFFATGQNETATLAGEAQEARIGIRNESGLVDMGGGNDTADASAYDEGIRIDGGSGNDSLTGGSAADFLRAESGNDELFGLGGNDTLDAGSGSDSLEGGLGDDTLRFINDNLDVTDTLRGGDGVTDTGIDTVEIRVLSSNPTATIGESSGIEIVKLVDDNFSTTNNPVTTLTFDASFNQKSDTGTTPETPAITVDATDYDFNEDLFLDGSQLAGDESIEVNGGDGDDSIETGAGNDTVNGGEGNDEIVGGDGNDVISGGDDDDILVGNDGEDVITDGEGDDIVVAGAGSDDITNGAGDDTFFVPDGTASGFVGGVDTLDGFSFDNNGVAGVGDKIGMILSQADIANLEIGTVTVAFASNLSDLESSNNIQDQFDGAGTGPTERPDAVLVKVVNGGLTGFHLLLEGGSTPGDFETFDGDGNTSTNADALITLTGGVFDDPATDVDTVPIDVSDFVSIPFLTTVNVTEDNVANEVGNALDQLFILPDGVVNSTSLNGGLGDDTLQGSGVATDISGVPVVDFETYDGNGNGDLTGTETQIEQFQTFTGAPTIDVTIDDLDGDAAVTSNPDVDSYSFTDNDGTLTFTFTPDGNNDIVTDFDSTGRTGTGVDVLNDGGADKLNGVTIDTGGGADVLNFGNVINIDPTTVDTGSGADEATFGGVTLSGAGDTLDGGSGTDQLTLTDDSDLSAGTFTGWENLILGDGVDLTITAAQHTQFNSITAPGSNTVTLTDGGTDTTFDEIETYQHNSDNALTLNLGSNAAQEFLSTGDAVDTINLGGLDVTGKLSTGDGDDFFNGITELTSTAELESGNGDDTFTIDATGGPVTVAQDAELDGGFGDDTLVINTGGNTVDISGADLDDIDNLEINGGGTIRMTVAQHATLRGAIMAAGTETIELANAGSATGDPVIENYVLSDDGNTFTVDGVNADNTGQSVTGGDGNDEVNFTAEGEITANELDLDGGAGEDTLNLTANDGDSIVFNGGDLRDFEEINVQLFGGDGGGDGAELFSGTMANSDVSSDVTFDFQGSQVDFSPTAFVLNLGALNNKKATINGLEILGAGQGIFVNTGNADGDSFNFALGADRASTDPMQIDLGLGDDDEVSIDLQGNDLDLDMDGGAADILNTEILFIEGESNTAGGAVIELGTNEDFERIDFSGLTGSNGIQLIGNTNANVDEIITGAGTNDLDVGALTSDFTVDAGGGQADISLDTDTTANDVLATIEDFTTGDDRLSLNGSTANEVSSVAFDNELVIGDLFILTEIGAAQVATGDLDQTGDSGAVEQAIVEARLDSTGSGGLSGDIYVALDDGEDIGIYRATVDSSGDEVIDSTGDITDVVQLALIDNDTPITDLDPADFF